MSVDRYKQAFLAARDELRKLQEEREEIERRIGQLKQTIVALAPLAREENLVAELAKSWMDQMGMADSVREVLKSAGKPLIASHVKDELAKRGADLSGYKNPLGSVHSVLRRLVESKEAIEGTDPHGSITYEWSPKALWSHFVDEFTPEDAARAVRAATPESNCTMPPAPVPDVYRSGMRGNEEPKKRK